MISYFVREIIQAARKDQEMLLGMLRNKFIRKGGIYMPGSPCLLKLCG